MKLYFVIFILKVTKLIIIGIVIMIIEIIIKLINKCLIWWSRVIYYKIIIK